MGYMLRLFMQRLETANSNRLFSFILIMMLASGPVLSIAQAPERIPYQAVIRNSSLVLVSFQPIGFRVSIYQGNVAGNPVYVEEHQPFTDLNGLISIEIGGGNVQSGVFQNIDWASGPYFVKTESDLNGGNNYTLNSVSRILSSPYALYAKEAHNSRNESNYTHYLGEFFGGGVIFHLWKDSTGQEHGLIASTFNQGANINWSNVTGVLIGNAAGSYSDGAGNSNAIVSQAGHIASAASQCLDLVLNGYSDWYLPAADELQLLFSNIYDVNRGLSQVPGAIELVYGQHYFWSSTEYAQSSALFSNRLSQSLAAQNKGQSPNYVCRAIRSF